MLPTAIGNALALVSNGTPTLQSDVTANDSDKTFTVSANKTWHVYNAFVKLVTTATVGNRQMAIRITKADDTLVAEIRAGSVQAAALTRYYNFAPGASDLTAFRDTDLLSISLPAGWILPAGWKVRIFDKAAIDAAADDMDVHLWVAERDV